MTSAQRVSTPAYEFDARCMRQFLTLWGARGVPVLWVVARILQIG